MTNEKEHLSEFQIALRSFKKNKIAMFFCSGFVFTLFLGNFCRIFVTLFL